jgi:uncharacterized protein YdeI (BOF family)
MNIEFCFSDAWVAIQTPIEKAAWENVLVGCSDMSRVHGIGSTGACGYEVKRGESCQYAEAARR